MLQGILSYLGLALISLALGDSKHCWLPGAVAGENAAFSKCSVPCLPLRWMLQLALTCDVNALRVHCD